MAGSSYGVVEPVILVWKAALYLAIIATVVLVLVPVFRYFTLGTLDNVSLLSAFLSMGTGALIQLFHYLSRGRVQ